MPNRSRKERRNIFSLYSYNHLAHLDQRDLSVSIRPNQSKVVLMITYKSHIFQAYKYINKKVHASNWINLKLYQTSNLFEIRLDNELVYNKKIIVPKVWKHVNLVTGSTNKSSNLSTIVYFRNFNLNISKKTGKK